MKLHPALHVFPENSLRVDGGIEKAFASIKEAAPQYIGAEECEAAAQNAAGKADFPALRRKFRRSKRRIGLHAAQRIVEVPYRMMLHRRVEMADRALVHDFLMHDVVREVGLFAPEQAQVPGQEPPWAAGAAARPSAD